MLRSHLNQHVTDTVGHRSRPRDRWLRPKKQMWRTWAPNKQSPLVRIEWGEGLISREKPHLGGRKEQEAKEMGDAMVRGRIKYETKYS